MAVWALEAYDTGQRYVLCRTYTRSQRRAERWAALPRIDFTDSGHGIVFRATEHSGKRMPIHTHLASMYEAKA